LSSPLPNSYRQLSRYALRYPADSVVYREGQVPDRFFLVLSGQIRFQVVDPNGEVSIVAHAGPGDLVGHVAAFTGRPTSAAASAAAESVLIAVPVTEAVEAFRTAPELALHLVEVFAESSGGRQGQRSRLQATEDVGADASAAPPEAPTKAARKATAIALEDGWDEAFFFADSITCPISGTRFEFLRVRTSAVRPVSRDSDFRIVYQSEDPTRYSIVACPECGYAAYHDDFEDLDDAERRALLGAQAERDALGPRKFTGTRTLEESALALDLAILCYAVRRPNERRRAVLLHRRAWLERERDGKDAELKFLRQARDAYQIAFEKDSSISDDTAMRAAYLIGDLGLRVGDIADGARWLETATRFPAAKAQSGLVRMAQERLQDARQAIKQAQKKSA
jgi:uncharacterized protein (DUF2225 family)/CRP-like cAMP-binding protein